VPISRALLAAGNGPTSRGRLSYRDHAAAAATAVVVARILRSFTTLAGLIARSRANQFNVGRSLYLSFKADLKQYICEL